MGNRVAVTGVGIISSLGTNLSHNWLSLKNTSPKIQPLKHFKSNLEPAPLVGEVSLSNTQLKTEFKFPQNQEISRTTLLALKAVQEALDMSNLTPYQTTQAAFISATSVGGMDIHEKSLPYLNTEVNFRYPGSNSFNLLDYFNINNHLTTICTACSSSANSILMGYEYIKYNQFKTVIVGGSDALCNFTLNGFNALMLVSKELCMPFDANRTGLNLGEGAAYLVLESYEDAIIQQKTILAEIVGAANANDAYHPTASAPNAEGATLSIKNALQLANINPSNIDYINCHGTATPNNDQTEAEALKNIFGDKIPKFSSTKAFTGHCLAAAGAIEAVFSILALQNQVVFPNLNFKTPMPNLQQNPVSTLTHTPLQYVLSNSYGFGGNCTSLIFKAAHV